jgi:periplasmic protein TonB
VKAPKKKPAPTPKRIPAPKKAIALPPVEKKPPAPEAQETIDAVEDSVDVEQKPTPIVAPRVDATRRSNPAPVYPRGSLRRHEQGKVILEVLILADGSVGEVRIKQSSGFKRLDRSAMKAVKRWRYIPAQQGDKAIEYWYQQPIVFSLRK